MSNCFASRVVTRKLSLRASCTRFGREGRTCGPEAGLCQQGSVHGANECDQAQVCSAIRRPSSDPQKVLNVEAVFSTIKTQIQVYSTARCVWQTCDVHSTCAGSLSLHSERLAAAAAALCIGVLENETTADQLVAVVQRQACRKQQCSRSQCLCASEFVFLRNQAHSYYRK